MTDPLPRMSAEEITELARDVVTNMVYVAWTPESFDCSFSNLLLLLAGGLREQGEDTSWMDNIGLVYADWDEAGTHRMNGYPMFLSAKFVHRDDRYPLQRECLRMAVAIGVHTQEELDKFDAELAEYRRRQEDNDNDDIEE